MAILRAPVRIDSYGIGAPAYNIWHIRTAEVAGVGEIDPLAALGALKTFYDTLKPQLAAGAVVKVPSDLLDITEDPPQDVPYSATTVAASSTADAPAVLAACINWKTGTRTRSGRGRTFFGPLAGNVIDSDGTFTPTAFTAISNAAGALVNASLADTGWAIGVYSRTEGLIRDITAYTLRDSFAVMRSRRQ